MRWLRYFLRFYPLQLPFFQFRRHFFLSLLWVLLWLIALGQIGRGFGVSELFYNPADRDYPNFFSTLAWGIAYGIFIIAYHLTTYLLDGHHAGFLLREKQPFLTYVLNNSLLPLTFWLFYLHIYTQKHHNDPNFGSQIGGIILGTFSIGVFFVLFLSNPLRDIFRLRRLGLLPPQRVFIEVSRAQSITHALHYYLTWGRGIQSSADAFFVNKKELTRLLVHYHRNAFIVEITLLVLISGWGYVQSYTGIYLPAAAAFLIFWAILYMLIGAISFWLRHWGGWAFIALAALGGVFLYWGNWWTSASAYGLSYRSQGVNLTVSSPVQDSLVLVECMDSWRRKQGDKAPLVWIQVSGGGWRSAFWTMAHLQLLDSLSGGKLWERTFAISGASGGLIGAAFWRDLGLFYPERRWNLIEATLLTQDALNPVLSTAVTGVFSPARTFQDSKSGERHPMGREYAFEQALLRHTRAFEERRLEDYAIPERESRCPLIFITPALLPVGKQLLISSQPCSPLTKQGYIEELRRLVPDAHCLRLTTALRMNASFPFVLPPVRLPTNPPLEVVDAGAIDNFGEVIALRFLWTFRTAIAERASRVILLEIRDLPEGFYTGNETSPSALGEFVRRLGGLYSSFTGARQILTRFSSELLRSVYPIPVEKYVFAYRSPEGYYPPLGFTLRPSDRAILMKALTDSLHLQRLTAFINALK